MFNPLIDYSKMSNEDLTKAIEKLEKNLYIMFESGSDELAITRVQDMIDSYRAEMMARQEMLLTKDLLGDGSKSGKSQPKNEDIIDNDQEDIYKLPKKNLY